MITKRKLQDLYVVGKDIYIGDDSGEEPIHLWLQKLNPSDHNIAVRKANAERAKAFSVLKKPVDRCPTCGAQSENAEQLDAIRSQLFDLDRDDLIELLTIGEIGKANLSIEAELENEEEWIKDDYLKGLNEAWDSELQVRYTEDPEDIDAKRVKEELDRYLAEFEKRKEGRKARILAEYEDKTDQYLFDKALEKQVELDADLSWLKAYRMCEVWLSVRDPDDHKIKYFESKEEVEQLQGEIFAKLVDEYQKITVDITAGKDSEAVQSSSLSSLLPDESGTEVSSGPEV